MTKPFVDLDNARKDEQRVVMQDIIAADECPFCLENLRKYHQQPILQETEHWLLTPNQWPYDHTKIHLLAIYKSHAERLAEIAPKAGQDLLELMQWAEQEYSVPGGGWAMRFGDTNYSAGTVLHIHAQFLVPDLDSPEYKPVRIKIGKTK
jgi:ATP adenylyltransferase